MHLVNAVTRAKKSTDRRRIKRVAHRVMLMNRMVDQTAPMTAAVRNKAMRIITRSLAN